MFFTKHYLSRVEHPRTVHSDAKTPRVYSGCEETEEETDEEAECCCRQEIDRPGELAGPCNKTLLCHLDI